MLIITFEASYKMVYTIGDKVNQVFFKDAFYGNIQN